MPRRPPRTRGGEDPGRGTREGGAPCEPDQEGLAWRPCPAGELATRWELRRESARHPPTMVGERPSSPVPGTHFSLRSTGCTSPHPLLKVSQCPGRLLADGSPQLPSKTSAADPNRPPRYAHRSDDADVFSGMPLTLLRPDCPDDAATFSYRNGCHPRPVNGYPWDSCTAYIPRGAVGPGSSHLHPSASPRPGVPASVRPDPRVPVPDAVSARRRVQGRPAGTSPGPGWPVRPDQERSSRRAGRAFLGPGPVGVDQIDRKGIRERNGTALSNGAIGDGRMRHRLDAWGDADPVGRRSSTAPYETPTRLLCAVVPRFECFK
jgi:hypothetical protein